MARSFLRPSPKFHGRLHRTVGAADTCRRVAPIADQIGVTRIADITGLDRLGIPTFSCVRPAAIAFSVAGVSVTCGKGTSREQARAGAMMEAIEYYCAEPGAVPMRHEAFDVLRRTERALDPRELILPNWSPYRADRKIYWVSARELATGEAFWVPANAVFHPFVPAEGEALILRGNTAGLASGNTIEEAICHGLAELIEHDARSLLAVRAEHGQADAFPGVDGGERDDDVAWLLGCFRRCQVELYIRDITTDVGVPTYYAAATETAGLRRLRHSGSGTHVDPAIALVRALTEAAQSRAADIQGSREDLAYLRGNAPADDVAGDREPWDFTEPNRRVPFPRGPDVDHTDIGDDIFWMVDRLAACGVPRVFVADLTRPELGVPVVRVIAPGLEHGGVDVYRVGSRARRAVASSVGENA